MMKKCERSSNFTPMEARMLSDLTLKYSHIVECKATDHKNNRKKKEIWCRIEQEFNSMAEGATYRKGDVLKRKYENVKKRLKEKSADELLEKSVLNSSELNRLLRLVEERENLIESFECDEQTKDEVWREIEAQYNEERSGVYRNWLVLKREYTERKKSTKKKLNKEKSARKITGGGVEDIVTLSAAEHELAGILGNRMTGDEAQYDCDADPYRGDEDDSFNMITEEEYEVHSDGVAETVVNIPTKKIESCSSKPQMKDPYDDLLDGTTDERNAVLEEPTPSWSQNTIPLLKKRKSACLSTAAEPDENTTRKRQYKTHISEWAQAKVALNELQRAAYREDCRLRRAREAELHAINVQKAKRMAKLEVEEIELRIECFKKKHAREMEILQPRKEKIVRSA